MIFVHFRSVAWRWLGIGSFGVFTAAMLAPGCDEPSTSPNLASNTNWLTACNTNADCGSALSCNCGACSGRCSSDEDCSAYSGATCVPGTEDAATALCGGSARWSGQGVCLPRCALGECSAGQFCALGICVPLVMPNSDFCSSIAEVDSASLANEEALVAAVEQARRKGELDCGDGTSTLALPLVRTDSRLTCAARVLARDMASTGNHHLTDSAGRGSADRLALAGYPQSLWAEGFAWDITDASTALQLMLEGADFCTGFSNGALMDLGVGYSGGVFVVTLATSD